MENKLEPIVKALQDQFKVTYEEFRGEVHVIVTAEQIIEALTLLRDKYEFELLSAMTAVDYWPQTSPPRIVLGSPHADGRPATGIEPRRVVSSRTAATMADILETVVMEGTRVKAWVPGYRIAGKTIGDGIETSAASRRLSA